MNILEILKESLLLEAIRINTPEDAYELIKNKKLGVKMHPSYNDLSDKYKEWDIELGVRNIIDSVNSNNIVYAVQLFVNKVPTDQLRKITSNDTIVSLVDYRNKPWTKQIPEYKEFIELNSKPINIDNLTDLSVMIKREAQRHGHGDKKDAKELYNDGTWTLQVPLSYKGAKAISFYGKKDEQQIPTEWCTRADEYQYDTYTDNNTKPLYIIRNWKTGKAYQMAISGNRVDFLDQNDVRGDEITKGDLTSIPDDLLKKIKYNDKETMFDFKKAVSEINSKMNKDISPEEIKKLKKRGYFNDATLSLENARWSDPIKVNDKISKRIFLNYGTSKKDHYENPMGNSNGSMSPSYLPDSINDWKDKTLKTVKGKSNEYIKLNGNIAAVYYFNDKPNIGFFMELENNKSVRENNLNNGSKSTTYHVIPAELKNRKWKETSLAAVEEKCPNFKDLLTVARSDFGADKTNKRAKEKDIRKTEEDINYMENIFHIYASRYIWPILDKKFRFKNNSELGIKFPKTFLSNGGFLPNIITCCVILDNRETNLKFYIIRNDGTFNIKIKSEDDTLKEIANELEVAAKKTMIAYSKDIVKDKKLSNIRINSRNGKGDRLQFENYFPY